MESEQTNGSVHLVKKGLNLLTTQLRLKSDSSQQFLAKQLKLLGLLKFRLEFMADSFQEKVKKGEVKEDAVCDMGTLMMEE